MVRAATIFQLVSKPLRELLKIKVPGLRCVYRCVHLSRSLSPLFDRSLHFNDSVQPAQLLQQLVAGAVQEDNVASDLRGGASAVSEAPLMLLNGHVCALLPKTLEGEHNGNDRGAFQLREPYQWESDDEATGFLLPRWMWSAVGGEAVRKS